MGVAAPTEKMKMGTPVRVKPDQGKETPSEVPTKKTPKAEVSHEAVVSARQHGVIIPAGACKIRPKGYVGETGNPTKNSWPTPATDDAVMEWATTVYDSGPNYTAEAVVYFIRQFWDINGEDYKRVRDLVRQVLGAGARLDTTNL